MLLTILKWRRLILLFGVVLMAAAGVAMWMRPTVAYAVAKILVNADSGAAPMAGLPMSRGGYSLESLRTEAEFLKSRFVLRPVATALLAERGQPDDIPESQLVATLNRLRERLTVTPVPNASVLQATYEAAVPAEAERILSMILDSYVKRDEAATRRAAVFEEQTDRAAANLQAAEERLRKWQETNNILSVEREITAQLERVSGIENALGRVEADIAATEVQVETLSHDVAELPPQSVTARTRVPNPLVARLRAELVAAETAGESLRRDPVTDRLRLDILDAEAALRDISSSPLVAKLRTDLVTAEGALHELRQRYTDEDRRVQEKLEQIRWLQQELATAERDARAAAHQRLEGLRQALTSAERNAALAARETVDSIRAQLEAAEREETVLGGETVAPDPLRESLIRELTTARSRLISLKSQRNLLRNQLAAATKTLTPLREQRVQFERLSREIEVAKSLYLQNVRRLDEARASVALEKEQFSNVIVIEPPQGVQVEGRARMIQISLLAAAVGLGLGVATAFVLEYLNRSLRTPDDVEFYLEVPVLATVPALPDPGRWRLALPPSRAAESQTT